MFAFQYFLFIYNQKKPKVTYESVFVTDMGMIS